MLACPGFGSSRPAFSLAILYTGIAKDVNRRCKQHNAGTASRYTRCRLPVELVYQEAHASQGSALRREAAIKALRRRQKLTLMRLAG